MVLGYNFEEVLIETNRLLELSGHPIVECSLDPCGPRAVSYYKQAKASEIHLSGALSSTSTSFVRDPAYMSPRPLGYQ